MKSSRNVVFLATTAALLTLAPAVTDFSSPRTQVAAAPQARVTEDRPEAVKPEPRRDRYEQIVGIYHESLAESLRNLAHVDMFYGPRATSPGFITGAQLVVPLGKNVGKADLDAIMRNPRFSKILHEFRQLDELAASTILNRELSTAANEYVKLYEAELRLNAPHFTLEKLSGRASFSGPGFAIDNVPEGQVVILGARLKVLALVWVAGMLELSDCREAVERVARIAVKQRDALYNDPNLHPFFKQQMLKRASLYNRQIISSGLLGVTESQILRTSIRKAAGIEWRVQQLAPDTSLRTPPRLPITPHILHPDHAPRSQTITFAAPLDDTEFDSLLRSLQATRSAKAQ